MAQITAIDELNAWDAYLEDVHAEYERAQSAVKEINMMLDQSQAELNKLAQRNASVSGHLQNVQSQIETLPRADIRLAYDAALDAQHRLFVMRGQLEKLQSDQVHLQKLIGLLERAQQFTELKRSTESAEPQLPVLNDDNAIEMVINAQEAEKQRLSRQMHDGPAQALSNFILQTEIALRLFDMDQVRAREELTNLKTAAMVTFQKVRSFIFELRPMMLDDLGVFDTITKYGETIKEQSGLELNIIVTGTRRRLEPYLEILVFRTFQELVSNVTKHSQATQAKVIVNIEDNSVRVSVEDNGKGFNPEQLAESSGSGLKRIRDRIQMVGGTVDVDAAQGQGTRVAFMIPTSQAQG